LEAVRYHQFWFPPTTAANPKEIRDHPVSEYIWQSAHSGRLSLVFTPSKQALFFCLTKRKAGLSPACNYPWCNLQARHFKANKFLVESWV